MSSETPNKPTEQHSPGDLLSDAKLVAEAAQSSLRNESDKFDKAKVADAAGNLLDAAEKYGKLDDQKGVGQYVDKAADYLHHQSSTPPTTTTTTTPSSDPPKGDESKGEAKSGGGFGDFAKAAGGFFK